MSELTHAEQTLRHIVESLSDEPDAIEIDVEQNDDTISFTARVAKDDMGRMIGRRGRVAHAIRTLVRSAAVKDGLKAEVEFAD